MAEQPTYLPMLSAIANAERQGHEYLRAWYDRATDPDLKETLRFVSNRELEHSLAFTKRIDELGFELECAEILDFSKQMEVVTSDCDDYTKAKELGLFDFDKYGNPDNDPFRSLFDDMTIDVQTGALLGRYIAEERDSGRRIVECARALEQRYASSHGDTVAGASSGRLDALEEKLDAICAAIDGLQQTVSAKAGTNGKSKAKVAVAS